MYIFVVIFRRYKAYETSTGQVFLVDKVEHSRSMKSVRPKVGLYTGCGWKELYRHCENVRGPILFFWWTNEHLIENHKKKNIFMSKLFFCTIGWKEKARQNAAQLLASEHDAWPSDPERCCGISVCLVNFHVAFLTCSWGSFERAEVPPRTPD